MSSIPYNYGSYIDAKVSMSDTGHVSAGKQIQSPASAGSRGLAKTTQFTNDRTQMQMGNSPIAESMVEIRNILNRIDGVNVPVREDEETHPLWGDWGTTPQEWSDTHVANNDDMVMAIAKGQIPPKPVTLSSYFDEQNDLWPEGVEGGKYNDEQIIDIISDTVGYDCRALGYDYLVKIRDGEVKGMYKPTPEQIKTAQEIIKNPEFAKARARNSRPMESTSEDAVNELADDDKIEFTKTLLDISQIKDRIERLSVDDEAKKSAIQSLTNAEEALVALDETAVREDAGEDEKVVDMLRKIKQHLDNHPNMSEHPSLVALDQLADDLESGDKPADYESADSGELARLKELSGIEEDAGFVPMPEGDEFDIEEDEDFEEVLGPLGFPEDETELFDAEYQGRKVPLNKPMRGDVKKFKVYVKDPKTGNVKKVNFGHGGTSAKKLGQKTMKIRKSNPKARKSFRARHNCANPGPKTKARYWSCRKW